MVLTIVFWVFVLISILGSAVGAPQSSQVLNFVPSVNLSSALEWLL